MFLPKYSSCTLAFLQQIATGKKKALRYAQIQPVARVKFGEFSVSRLFELVKDDSEVILHLPDATQAKRVPKDFVWTVIYNLRPQWLDKCIFAAREQRR